MRSHMWVYYNNKKRKRHFCKKITNVSREKSNQGDLGRGKSNEQVTVLGDGSEMTVGYFMN